MTPKNDQKMSPQNGPSAPKMTASRGHHGNKSTREYGINLDEVNILHRDIDTIEVHGQVGSAEGHLAQYNS